MLRKDFNYWLKKALAFVKTGSTSSISLTEYKSNATDELKAVADGLPPKKSETAREYKARILTNRAFKAFISQYTGTNKDNKDSRTNTFAYMIRDKYFAGGNIEQLMAEKETLLKVLYLESYPPIKDTLREDKAKRVEQEKKQQEKHLEQGKKDFRSLFRNVYGEAGKFEDIWNAVGKNKVLFVKRIKDLAGENSSQVKLFVEKYFAGDAPVAFYYAIRDYFMVSSTNLDDVWTRIQNGLKSSYKVQKLDTERQTLIETIPESFLKFLPDTLIVQVDNNKKITGIKTMFAEKMNDMEAKIERQKKLLLAYGRIRSALDKDIAGSNHNKKIMGLIISIMLETGIRPGNEGMGVPTDEIDEEGNELEKVQTYGASTLLKQHFKKLRDGGLELNFIGKKGSLNIAQITNPQLVKILEKIIESTGENKYVFENDSGALFTQAKLTEYLVGIAGFAIKLTDFRKLKASQTVLDSLKASQKEIYKKIVELHKAKVTDVKDQIISLTLDAVSKAYLDASIALNHQHLYGSADTTINSYINPQVLLSFLSTGKMADKLDDIVVSGQTTLRFDPQILLEQAIANA